MGRNSDPRAGRSVSDATLKKFHEIRFKKSLIRSIIDRLKHRWKTVFSDYFVLKISVQWYASSPLDRLKFRNWNLLRPRLLNFFAIKVPYQICWTVISHFSKTEAHFRDKTRKKITCMSSTDYKIFFIVSRMLQQHFTV